MNRFKHEILRDRHGIPVEDAHIQGMQGPPAAFSYKEKLTGPEILALLSDGVGLVEEADVAQSGLGAGIVFVKADRQRQPAQTDFFEAA